jgi:hypothetical protein
MRKKNNLIKINKYSLFSLSTTCFILGRALEQSKTMAYEEIRNSTPYYQQFIDKCSILDKGLLDQIALASKKCLK